MKHFIWFLAHLANPISSEPISVGFLKFYNFCWKGTVDLEFPDSRQLEKWFIIAGHYEVYKIQMSHYVAFKPLILPLLYVNSEYNEINWTIMFKVILLELVPLFQFVKKQDWTSSSIIKRECIWTFIRNMVNKRRTIGYFINLLLTWVDRIIWLKSD